MTATRPVVTARPIRSARIAIVVAAAILALFTVAAIVLPHATGGARPMGWRDQLGLGLVGLVVAGVALLPTRPRLEADEHEVRARAYLGAPRTIPWQFVQAVEFPAKVRFARLVLPGDETVALYAVQRLDRDYAVEVMRQLRRLHAQAQAAPQ
jgi:Bacterial PH domain